MTQKNATLFGGGGLSFLQRYRMMDLQNASDVEPWRKETDIM